MKIESLKNIHHKNIAKILEISESEKYIYVLKEYIEGMNLKKFVRDNGPLDEEAIKSVLNQLIDIFEYFHNQEKPIIYRDLKPENIIYDEDKNIFLIDLVTIREINNINDSDTFYIGTRGYASPEQYGFSQTNSKSDIYTIGTTLYFLVTGQEPLNHNITLETLKSNSLVSEKYKMIINKCCAFDPNNRYGSVKEIRDDVNKKIIHKNVKRKLMILLLFMIIISSMITYSQRYKINYFMNYPIYNKNDIQEPTDIPVNNIKAIEKGIIIREIDSEVVNIQLDLKMLGSPFDKIKYIAVGTSNSFQIDTKALLQQNIFYAVIKGYGYQEYTPQGFNSVIEGCNEMLILIFDENNQCLGYHLISDLNKLKFSD